MDFVDWCDSIFRIVQLETKASSNVRIIGLSQAQLACLAFGNEVAQSPAFAGSSRGHAIFDAMAQLGSEQLVEHSHPYCKLSSFGRQHADDLTPVWEAFCEANLSDEQRQLLSVTNRLSPQCADDHAWLLGLENMDLMPKLKWTDSDLLWSVADELSDLGLIKLQAFMGGGVIVHSTYRGLVWETRRDHVFEARRIDNLVAEWETTSVDFKREVHLKTADEKAEFVKDVIGLANTQASGQRWLIIGFDPKTHRYYGPPDQGLTQDRMEQILTLHTEPAIQVRYDTVAYRGGVVGRIEVLRDRQHLPYVVAKSIGDKKRIEQGWEFVRHGSQTERATPRELQALHDEGERARSGD